MALQLPAGLPFPEWERAGHQLAGVLSSSAWWLGDWLVYGREHYSDRYERAIKSAGLQYQTLRNYAWVASRFGVPRRRPALSFQHHAELAALDSDEQERWLNKAQELGLSIKRLRVAMREARSDAPRPEHDPGTVQRLAVPDERFRRWHAAAAQVGTDVEQWVMATLDHAAEQILSP